MRITVTLTQLADMIDLALKPTRTQLAYIGDMDIARMTRIPASGELEELLIEDASGDEYRVSQIEHVYDTHLQVASDIGRGWGVSFLPATAPTPIPLMLTLI